MPNFAHMILIQNICNHVNLKNVCRWLNLEKLEATIRSSLPSCRGLIRNNTVSKNWSPSLCPASRYCCYTVLYRNIRRSCRSIRTSHGIACSHIWHQSLLSNFYSATPRSKDSAKKRGMSAQFVCDPANVQQIIVEYSFLSFNIFVARTFSAYTMAIL